MARRGLPSRPARRLLHQPYRTIAGEPGRPNLPMRARFALVANLDPSVLPFAHRHLGLPGGIIALPLQLQVTVLVTHHPVVGNAPRGLQTKHLFQFPRIRRLAMIVLWCGGWLRKTLVVIGQVFFLQKPVGFCMRADLLAPHLLDQAILMRPVSPLHSALGLRRVRRDDPDIQLLAHAPELRHWHFPVQPFLFRRLAHIHVLPIRVQRQRHSVLLDPLPQHPRCRPNGFFLPQRPPPSRSHRPPCSSGRPAGLASDTTHENCRPTAPTRRSGPCARAASGAAYVSAPCSTALRPASSAAAFPDEPVVGPRGPNAPRPTSARSASAHLRCIFPVPVSGSGCVPSPVAHGWTGGRHCRASAPPLHRLGTASTGAWSAGS